MSDASLRELVHIVTLLIVVFLAVAIAARQIDRVMRHRLFGEEQPQVLIRDVAFFVALALIIVVPTIAGVFGIILAEHMWWVITRALLAVFALLVIAYYEFFVIGKYQD